jgi:uroporphyrinogen decarboxylase
MSLPDELPFAGLRVVAFESRMAQPMAELIARQGGVPLVAPALREIPLDDNAEALAFGDRLLAGEFDVVVFLTGVGTRQLAQVLETRIPRAAWVGALSRTEVVVRGPKPLAALRELKARVDLQVPEPNTWHELLAALDDRRSLLGVRVAVQEYGKPNPELITGLRQRGAEVTSVPVYRWALPEDIEPLQRAIAQIVEGHVGAVLFTSAQQLVHVLQVAAASSTEAELRAALASRVVIGSIGPTTTEALMEHGLVADVEPEHPKMGHLVQATALRWRETPKSIPRTAYAPRRSEPVRVEALPPTPGRVTPQLDGPFLRACRREPTDVTPIWLMRQAGRYMAEYRELRSLHSFLDLCKRPELAAEVTVTAVERLGVDAAILFADILLILEPLGFNLEFARGAGPVIRNPVREPADVDRVHPVTTAEPLGYVLEAVRLIRDALRVDLPLIGFAGAPFTLACYAIEGGGSRHYEKAKAFMYRDPAAWDTLMQKLVVATAAYLNAQVAAGAQAIQVFDSWVGTLSPFDYRRYVQPHMARLFAALPGDVPVIHFGTGTGSLLELQRDAGGDVIGLDWRVELDGAWDRLGPEVAIQGNLDPVVLLAEPGEIRRQAGRILEQARRRPGHIFNLGHGILPTTPVDSVRALIDFVHENSGPVDRLPVP